MSGGDSQKRAFRVAYDGREYHGFQRQPDVETIESVIFDGLAKLDIVSDDAIPAEYSAAGRTDAGVSALVQTIAFQCPDWLKPSVVNSVLPGGIWAWAWVDVPDDFNARYSACQREYTYFLHLPTTTHDDAVSRAATRLSGEHDFQRFSADTARTIRRIEFRVRRDGDFLVIRASAEGFPRQLVRRVVGFLESIGVGDCGVRDVELLFDVSGTGVPRVSPAAPEPLVLTGAEYDVDFLVDDTAVHATARSLREQWSSLVAQARVAESLFLVLEELAE